MEIRECETKQMGETFRTPQNTGQKRAFASPDLALVALVAKLGPGVAGAHKLLCTPPKTQLGLSVASHTTPIINFQLIREANRRGTKEAALGLKRMLGAEGCTVICYTLYSAKEPPHNLPAP